MAEVKKVSGKMQLDTEGGSVRATFDMVVESGTTKAVLGTEEAAGGFTGEIGVTNKTGLGNTEAAGASTGEIRVTKAGLGNTEAGAAGASTGEIGVTKAVADSSTPEEIDFTKAPEIDDDKAVVVSSAHAMAVGALARAWLEKAAASGEFGITNATLNKCLTGKGLLGVAPCKLPAAGSLKPKEAEGKHVTKERVPDAFIERIKRCPRQKTRPLAACIAAGNPKARERFLAAKAHIDYLVDLEQDCLRQYKEKGYAEIGVDYTGEFKKVFILPNPEPEVK